MCDTEGFYLHLLLLITVPLKIRSSDYDLTLADLKEIHFKLMNQQCPVHFRTPYVESTDGEIEYSCCCDKLKNLCLLVIATKKTSNRSHS